MNAILQRIQTTTEARYALYLAAEAAIVGGAQSYSIGNRTLSRADLDVLRKEIDLLEKKLIKLGRGGAIRLQRVVPRMP